MSEQHGWHMEEPAASALQEASQSATLDSSMDATASWKTDESFLPDFESRLSAASRHGFVASSSKCSANSSPVVAHLAANMKVKNTFLECSGEREDEDDELPVVATKSCPMVRMPFSPGIDSRFTTLHECGESGSSPVMYIRPSTSLSTQAPSENLGGTEAAAKARVPCSPDVLPLGLRKPEMSVGSAAHGGECRPCAWFWRPQGCTNGADCRHCHLCPEGEVKARRKSKLASLKARNREANEAPAPEGETRSLQLATLL